jgi:hypothetical protein
MKKVKSEDDKQSIDIKLSRWKMFLAIVGSFLFVLLGVLFIYDPQGYTSPMARSPAVLFVSGIASVTFFGVCLLYALYKIIDTKFGLRLDSEGIYDNSNIASSGLIRWKDIKEIRAEQVASTKMLIILTSKDDEYINNASNFFKKCLMKLNRKWYDSPIIISSSSLKIDFDTLKRLVKSNWRKYK